MTSHRFIKSALFVLVLLTPIFVAAARVARADSWPTPTPGIYASSGKPSYTRFGFHLVPDAKRPFAPATGTLYTLDREGKMEVRWTRKLVNLPYHVIVGKFGNVATIDNYTYPGLGHSVVIYKATDGKVLADKALRDLISVEEIDKYTDKNKYNDSCSWAHKAKMEFRHNYDDPTKPSVSLR